jgi:S-adenosylmethionine-diacylgycerolhomoserine-N-methlytransferase
MSEAAALMDRMYRRQRHIYDFSRKFYLLGRDAMIVDVRAEPGDAILEIGCGTARNLIKLARAYPEARCCGLDVSAEMLDSARRALRRAGLEARIALAQGDATAFDAEALFGRPRFERIVISYALSMIPPWRETLARAIDTLAPGGSLHIVDFGDQSGLPAPFRNALNRWLAAFDVTPRADLSKAMADLAEPRGVRWRAVSRFRGYAVHAIAERGG